MITSTNAVDPTVEFRHEEEQEKIEHNENSLYE